MQKCSYIKTLRKQLLATIQLCVALLNGTKMFYPTKMCYPRKNYPFYPVYPALLVLAAVLALGVDGSFIEESLQKRLFSSYNKNVIPISVPGGSVKIDFGLSLINIGYVNREQEEIGFNFWGRFTWNDYRLRWNATNFHNVSVIRVPQKWLWKPDLAAYTSLHDSDHYFVLGGKNVQPLALVYSTGKVLSIPPIAAKVRCKFESAAGNAFKCSLKYGSWTYDGNMMKLGFYVGKTEVDTADYYDKNYEILSSSIEFVNKFYPCCAEPYPHFLVNITMKAK